MRVRSFRNTVLSFSILRLQRYCKAAGKQREGAFLVGSDWADGGRLSLCPTKRLFTSADDGE